MNNGLRNNRHNYDSGFLEALSYTHGLLGNKIVFLECELMAIII